MKQQNYKPAATLAVEEHSFTISQSRVDSVYLRVEARESIRVFSSAMAQRREPEISTDSTAPRQSVQQRQLAGENIDNYDKEQQIKRTAIGQLDGETHSAGRGCNQSQDNKATLK